MKFFILFSLLFVLSCASNPSSDGSAFRAPTNAVGGWTEQPLDWDTALKDFELVKEKANADHPEWTSLTLRRVESQVVAGFHVRLTVAYNDASGENLLRAVLFHDIDGNITLDALEAPYLPEGENQ